MSHFSVAVFTRDGQTVEELLAPYQENNMGDCPKEYLRFKDTEDEYRSEFETGTRQEFFCEGGSSWGQSISSENFQRLKHLQIGETITLDLTDTGSYLKRGSKYRLYDNSATSRPEEVVWGELLHVIRTSHPNPDVCYEGIIEIKRLAEPRDIPMKEYYNNDFEHFIKDWAGYERRDPYTNRYGYWENPNSKWDWYQIGGRFSGQLNLKSGATTGQYGERSWTNQDEVISDNRVDSAKLKDVDFSMDLRDYQRSIRVWELIVEGDTPQNEEEKDIASFTFYKPEYYTSRYGSKEEYAKQSAEFGTYAVITPDGVWHSKGDMGWFGMSSESHDEAKQWNKSFKETFIDNADPEWTLTVVDCHI